MKSKLTFLLSAIIVVMFAFGCSEKDSTGNDDPTGIPPELSEIPELIIAIPDSANLVNYTSELVDYDGEDVIAYSLTQFLDLDRDYTTELEYSYELVSDDGYSPREGGNPELTWIQFETGYLLPTEKYRTFFPSDDIETAYDVKYASNINLYRTITVVSADGTQIPFQTGAIDTTGVYHQAGNGEFYTDPGFELAEFISEYVTGSPEEHEYHFTNSEDETEIITWENIQAAYWLTTRNKAVFINDEGEEIRSSFKHLIKIELI